MTRSGARGYDYSPAANYGYEYQEDGVDDDSGVRVSRTADGRRVTVKLSTALYPNRIRDKLRVETQLKLPEGGNPFTAFYARRSGGLLIATGYERIVYGDHGPYIEFSDHQIRWSAFPRFKPRSPWSYYDLWCTSDQRLELYAQKRRVTGKPNPPSGQWSVCNHRPEGYADYRVGMCYVAIDVGDIEAVIQPLQAPPPSNVAPPDRSRSELHKGVGCLQRGGACSSPAPVRASIEEWRLSELEGLAMPDVAGRPSACASTNEAPPSLAEARSVASSSANESCADPAETEEVLPSDMDGVASPTASSPRAAGEQPSESPPSPTSSAVAMPLQQQFAPLVGIIPAAATSTTDPLGEAGLALYESTCAKDATANGVRDAPVPTTAAPHKHVRKGLRAH